MGPCYGLELRRREEAGTGRGETRARCASTRARWTEIGAVCRSAGNFRRGVLVVVRHFEEDEDKITAVILGRLWLSCLSLCVVQM